MRRLNERSALASTIKQFGIKDPSAIRYAYGLVVETTRRKNLIDKLVNNVVDPKKSANMTWASNLSCDYTFTKHGLSRTGVNITSKKQTASQA